MSTLSASRKPSPGRREQQRQETAQAIRAAALELFGARGFAATTTKEIAERAGVAHGTVFLVAPSKEGLLVAALEVRLREVMAARVATLPKRSVHAQLLHVFDGLFDFYASERGLSREFLRAIMFFADPVAKAQYDAHVSAFLRYLASLFDQGKARGEIAPKIGSDGAASVVLALYVHCVIGFLNDDESDRARLGERFRVALDTVFRGFRPAAPRPAKRPAAKAAPARRRARHGPGAT